MIELPGPFLERAQQYICNKPGNLAVMSKELCKDGGVQTGGEVVDVGVGRSGEVGGGVLALAGLVNEARVLLPHRF